MGGNKLPIDDTFWHPIYGVISFVGLSFSCGLAGGSAVHLVRGLRGSPGGARVAGAVSALRAGAPRVAGQFGAYCALFSAVESAATLARPDFAWSSAAAAAATLGLRGMLRGGAFAALRCALFGAAVPVALEQFDLVTDEIIVERQERARRPQSCSEPEDPDTGAPIVVEEIPVDY